MTDTEESPKGRESADSGPDVIDISDDESLFMIQSEDEALDVDSSEDIDDDEKEDEDEEDDPETL